MTKYGSQYPDPRLVASVIKARREREEAQARDAKFIAEQPLHTSAPLQVKSIKGRLITGYASVFNVVDRSSPRDIVLPGAFKRTLAWWAEQDEPLPLRDMHDRTSVHAIIGRARSMKEDHHGLLCTFELVAGEEGEKIATRIRQGLVSGLSIGYRALNHRSPTWPEREKGAERVLIDVWLDEVSLVDSPSCKPARVHAIKAEIVERNKVLDRWISQVALHGHKSAFAGLSDRDIDVLMRDMTERLKQRGARDSDVSITDQIDELRVARLQAATPEQQASIENRIQELRWRQLEQTREALAIGS